MVKQILSQQNLGKIAALTAAAFAAALTLNASPFTGVAYADTPTTPTTTPTPTTTKPLLSGTLRCIGKNKRGEDTYTGEVHIIPFNDIYLITWDINGSTHIGQAIERHGHLAVIYLTADKSIYGIALYKKIGDDWLGTWVGADGDITAGELWTP